MKISITLTVKQLKLLHQVFDEQLSVGNSIEAHEIATAEEIVEILETAENKITSLY